MAINQTKTYFTYNRAGNTVRIPPQPIIEQRDPGDRDQAQLGTMWVNTTEDTVWCLTSMHGGVSTWSTSPASGLGTFTSVTVTPGDLVVTDGDVTITLGNLDVTAGNVTIGGDLTVDGTTTIVGDIAFSSPDLISLTSTFNGNPSVLLHSDGGTAEGIELHADQGSSLTSINIHSDVGGIALVSGLANADAISLTSTVGGVDIDGVLQVNVESSQVSATAVVLSATAGGIS